MEKRASSVEDIIKEVLSGSPGGKSLPKKTIPKNGKVISFINLKGGVGKTTLCLTIGEILAFEKKKQVLLIDLDSQSNLSSAVTAKETLQDYGRKKSTIYHLFKRLISMKTPSTRWNIEDAIVDHLYCSNIKGNKNFSAILSLPELGQFDEDLADALEEQSRRELLSSIRVTVEWRRVLKNHISILRSKYDYILIDCPPSLSLFTSNAIVASDYFVTPISPEYLSKQGLDLIMGRISRLRQRLADVGIDFAGCIINRVDIRRGDHIRLCEEIYGHSEYRAFKYWVGDLKPMYIVTDYYYPWEKYWP